MVDKYKVEIKEGCKVKFLRPVWDSDGTFRMREVIETVKRLDNGELYANNYEEDCFFIPLSETEIIN